MKMTTKFVLAGVLLAVMVLAGCDGGNDVESNIGAVAEIASVEEVIEEEKIAHGTTEIDAEKAQQQEAEGVKELVLTDENTFSSAENNNEEVEPQASDKVIGPGEMKETEEKAVKEVTIKDENEQVSTEKESEETATPKEVSVKEVVSEEIVVNVDEEENKEEEKIAAEKTALGENKAEDHKEEALKEKPVKEKETVEEVNFAGNLQKFYGRWETKEENPAEKIILEMGLVDANDLHNSDEGFQYIRFGYEASEFFPREKITKSEDRSNNTYVITVAILEENYENGNWSVVETGKIEEYRIELSDQNNMILTYSDDGGKTEFVFYKQ